MAAYPEAKCFHPEVFGETSQKCVLQSANGRRTIFNFSEEDLPTAGCGNTGVVLRSSWHTG